MSLPPIQDLTGDNVRRLVAESARELQDLEYKRDLPGNKDADKREFLADVSSLANSAGGYILFGMESRNGSATSARGLRQYRADADRLRLEEILRSGLDPRIQQIQFKELEGFPEGPVLALWTPVSFARPHLITFQDWSRFYARGVAGKFIMDVRQIRDAFVATSTLRERLEAIRDQRWIAARTLDIGVGFPDLLVQLIPYVSIDGAERVQPRLYEENLRLLRTPVGRATNSRYTSNGYAFYSVRQDGDRGGSSRNYALGFRSGMVEYGALDRSLRRVADGHERLGAVAIENRVIEVITNYQLLLARVGVAPPFGVLVTVMAGMGAVLDEGTPDPIPARIGEAFLRLPLCELTHAASDPRTSLRPAFDVLWQAAGWPGSPSYDSSGRWVRR
ncbi:MAG TPA: ATP-binding protein [Planctomycetota bacterium]|nr:ATP-binding protein [Planctomycetota bacterium]